MKVAFYYFPPFVMQVMIESGHAYKELDQWLQAYLCVCFVMLEIEESCEQYFIFSILCAPSFLFWATVSCLSQDMPSFS